MKDGILPLENGDTVLVPPIRGQVTLEGMVRRPSLYELNGEKDLAQVLELAGGILPAATLRHIEVQRLIAHEKHTMLSVDIPEVEDADFVQKKLEAFAIQDGDTIRIFPIASYNQDIVYLEGHVLRPGRYSYRKGMKIDLVSGYKDLLPEPSAKYAEIVRLNAPDFRPSVVGFDLAAALSNPATPQRSSRWIRSGFTAGSICRARPRFPCWAKFVRREHTTRPARFTCGSRSLRRRPDAGFTNRQRAGVSIFARQPAQDSQRQLKRRAGR